LGRNTFEKRNKLVEMGTEEAVYNAFQVLSDGGVIIEPIGEL
jgi:hypothetical protein